MASLAERFDQYVSPEPTSGCALWTGASAGRYGVFWLDGRNVQAHHVAFFLATGRWPSTPVLRHKCDVSHCVEFRHLIEGTQAQNIADKVARGRQVRGEDQRGGTRGGAVLNEEQVRRMRAQHAAGASLDDLASEFDVDRSNVWLIVTRKTWREVA